MQAFCLSLAAHRHRIVLVQLPSWPLNCCLPIVVSVDDDVNVAIVIYAIVVATVTVHFTVVIVTIVPILVVGVTATAVAVVVNIIARCCLLSLCSLADNCRYSTKASQGGIAHGMGMERISLDWP